MRVALKLENIEKKLKLEQRQCLVYITEIKFLQEYS